MSTETSTKRPRRFNSPEAQEIVKLLDNSGNPLSVDQIAAQLQQDLEQTRSLVELLRRRGIVVVSKKYDRKDARTYTTSESQGEQENAAEEAHAIVVGDPLPDEDVEPDADEPAED